MAAKVYDNLVVTRPFTWKGRDFAAGERFDMPLALREHQRLTMAHRLRETTGQAQPMPAPAPEPEPAPAPKPEPAPASKTGMKSRSKPKTSAKSKAVTSREPYKGIKFADHDFSDEPDPLE